MDSFRTWLATEGDASKMTFGKYAGTPVADLPDSYLSFLLSPEFHWVPKYAATKKQIEDEVRKRAAPKQSAQQPAGDDRLRAYGLDLAKAKLVPTGPHHLMVNLQPAQVETLARAVSETYKRLAFERNQYYSEAVLPTRQAPGWICFKFHDVGGTIERWDYSGQIKGHYNFYQHLSQHIDQQNGNRIKEVEDKLFAYTGNDNSGFDKLLKELERAKHGVKETTPKHQAMASKFVEDAVKFWEGKLTASKSSASANTGR